MQALLDAINASCREANWYAVVYMSLTLPDICASLENPKKSGKGDAYKRWARKYFDISGKKHQQQEAVTADDLWRKRLQS